jgi:hypothetical protein
MKRAASGIGITNRWSTPPGSIVVSGKYDRIMHWRSGSDSGRVLSSMLYGARIKDGDTGVG